MALICAGLTVSNGYKLLLSGVAAPVPRSRAALRLDPNTASRSELMLLPRIGPSLSREVVQYREHCGSRPAFGAAEDLDAVRGIGPATIVGLREFLRFGPESSDEEK